MTRGLAVRHLGELLGDIVPIGLFLYDDGDAARLHSCLKYSSWAVDVACGGPEDLE